MNNGKYVVLLIIFFHFILFLDKQQKKKNAAAAYPSHFEALKCHDSPSRFTIDFIK